MRGTDISHWQKGLSIQQVKDAGCDFAIIKLTEGNFLIDSAAFGFYHEAFTLGFPVGCYCYSHATTAEQARREAEFLIETIKGFPMPCGIFLDVEAPETLELPAEKLIDILNAWCKSISGAGYKPGIYGSEYCLWAKLRADVLPEGTLVWVAHYGHEPDIACDLWQSGDSGSIDGYSGQVDTDEVRSRRFQMLVNGFPQQTQEPTKKSDPIVMQMQACLRWAGCWPEKIDGVCSDAFRKRLREYAITWGT